MVDANIELIAMRLSQMKAGTTPRYITVDTQADMFDNKYIAPLISHPPGGGGGGGGFFTISALTDA